MSCADMCREQLAKTREKGLSTSRKRLPHHLFTGWFPRGVRCGQQRSGVLGESDTQLLAVELSDGGLGDRITEDDVARLLVGGDPRSEERRVGKERRSRCAP